MLWISKTINKGFKNSNCEINNTNSNNNHIKAFNNKENDNESRRRSNKNNNDNSNNSDLKDWQNDKLEKKRNFDWNKKVVWYICQKKFD